MVLSTTHSFAVFFLLLCSVPFFLGFTSTCYWQRIHWDALRRSRLNCYRDNLLGRHYCWTRLGACLPVLSLLAFFIEQTSETEIFERCEPTELGEYKNERSGSGALGERRELADPFLTYPDLATRGIKTTSRTNEISNTRGENQTYLVQSNPFEENNQRNRRDATSRHPSGRHGPPNPHLGDYIVSSRAS